MDVIRRNTDYAIRLVVNLVENYNKGPKSVRQLAREEDVFYDLASKLLQKLTVAEIVKSKMGPKGGFELAKLPAEISLFDVVGAIQGAVILNRCLNPNEICPRQPRCTVSAELAKLQDIIKEYLVNIKLDSMLKCRKCNCERK